MKLLILTIVFLVNSKAWAVERSCRELIIGPIESKNGQIHELDTWIPVTHFSMTDSIRNTSDIEPTKYFNPHTNETRQLPHGWVSMEYAIVSSDQEWTPVAFGRAQDMDYNMVNIRTGEFLLNPDSPQNTQFKSIYNFSSFGYALAANGKDEYAILNRDGKVTHLPEMHWVSPSINAKYFPALTKDFEPVLLDLEGRIHKVKLPENFGEKFPGQLITTIQDFTKDGLAIVKLASNPSYDPKSKFGYIDLNLSFVIEPKFDDAMPFYLGEAWVKRDGRWGKINREGEWIMNPRFILSPSIDIDSNEFFIAQESGKNTAVYDSEGRYLYDLPESALNGRVNFSIKDGIVGLRYDSRGDRFFNLRTKEWIGDTSLSIKSNFVDGIAYVEVHGERSVGGFHSFGEGFIDMNGNFIVFIPRFGKPENILPAQQLRNLETIGAPNLPLRLPKQTQ